MGHGVYLYKPSKTMSRLTEQIAIVLVLNTCYTYVLVFGWTNICNYANECALLSTLTQYVMSWRQSVFGTLRRHISIS